MIFTTTFKNSTYLSSISNLSPPVDLPVFTIQPQSQTVDEYATATFTATADNATSYQWSKNVTDVGTDSTNYSFATTAADNGAVVNVTAAGAGGSTVSNSATLTVVSYAFQFDGTTQNAVLSSPVAALISSTFEVSVDIYITEIVAANQAIMGGDNISANGNFSLFTYNGIVSSQLTTTTGARYGTGTALNLNAWNTVKLSWDLTTMKIIVNGVESSISSKNVTGINVTTLAAFATSSRNKCRLRNFAAKVNGIEVRKIPLNNKGQGANQSSLASGGSASILNYNASGWVAV